MDRDTYFRGEANLLIAGGTLLALITSQFSAELVSSIGSAIENGEFGLSTITTNPLEKLVGLFGLGVIGLTGAYAYTSFKDALFPRKQ